jgi:CrcB protein
VTALVVGAVLLAGAAGAALRYAAGLAVSRTRSRLPWAVLVVNVVGSLVAGLVVGLGLDGDARLVIVTGFAGGLTTFSTLSVETVQLAMEGRWRTAVGSMAANLVVGVAAATLGYLLGLLVLTGAA